MSATSNQISELQDFRDDNCRNSGNAKAMEKRPKGLGFKQSRDNQPERRRREDDAGRGGKASGGEISFDRQIDPEGAFGFSKTYKGDGVKSND